MNEELIRALITIASGAVAGGLTNTVAIWMLFHPYEPPKLLGRPVRFLQGAVPKNQPRLASAIGRTVGTRLLTEEDLAKIFGQAEFREAFDERLSAFIAALLEVERGSMREILGPDVMEEVDRIVDEVVQHSVSRLQEYLSSDGFEEFVESRASQLVESVTDEPVGGVLTPAREAIVTDAVDDWIKDAAASDGFQEAISDYVDRGSSALLTPERTVQDILPAGLVGSLEKAIAGFLPLAIQRLGALLENPAARERFERAIHDVLHRFLQDLKLHQRVVARLVMTEDTIEKVLDTIEDEGADRLSELLREQEVQDAMAKGVKDAISDLMRRPVTQVLGEPEDPAVASAQTTVVRWVLDLAQDPSTREFLVEKLNQGLDRASSRTWGEVFEHVPPEKLSKWLIGAARSDAATKIYQDGIRRIADGAFDRPIGRPADWLPDGAPRRVEKAIGNPLWSWLQGQIPDVTQRIDVARRVEEKVMEFPMEKMEELVRKVTDRELRTIIRLGYALGAFIGMILVVLNQVLA